MLTDWVGSSVSLPVLTLSGSTITSSHYQMRQALLSLGQQPFSDTPRVDRIYLVRKTFIWCVILSSSDRPALMDRQFSRCSSWCGHLYFATAHPILQAIKNRYWPLWYVLWQFVGRHPRQLACCFLQPGPNPQTAYFSPTYPKKVIDP